MALVKRLFDQTPRVEYVHPSQEVVITQIAGLRDPCGDLRSLKEVGKYVHENDDVGPPLQGKTKLDDSINKQADCVS